MLAHLGQKLQRPLGDLGLASELREQHGDLRCVDKGGRNRVDGDAVGGEFELTLDGGERSFTVENPGPEVVPTIYLVGLPDRDAEPKLKPEVPHETGRRFAGHDVFAVNDGESA